MIDSHAHLQDERFADDVNEVMERAFSSGISHIVCVGYDLPSTREALAIAEREPRLLVMAGLHPHEAASYAESDLAELYQLARHPRVVAVGEIGLDYYYDADYKDQQEQLLQAQIKMAREIGKPVVIHDRDAHQDILRIVREENADIFIVHLRAHCNLLYSRNHCMNLTVRRTQ
jgi:TatD DNase family protein